MNVKGGQMDVWIKSTSWWNNNQRCAAAEAVTIVVLFIISIIWSYTLIHFIQRGSDQINHHVWTSLPANVLTAVNFTLNLFNRLLQNVKISNMCIFTCKKETFQSVLYSNVCPISVMSVIENGSVYFQTHSANANELTESHLCEGISCCLPPGFALRENIIRKWADLDRMPQAYLQAEGTSCSLWGETEMRSWGRSMS